ncbi:MAG TPA: carboxypeptidase-like regulatory domain-containing protein [Bryobacteraceae bacterium]|nr:carboxypeptidase-like regulatory domain-containing protein [Bryobacteraceae bacterium]
MATVTGTITDATGAVVANAPVSVKNTETGQVYAGASSDTGNYTVTQLPIGDYNLTVTSPGFKIYEHQKFHLSAGQALREDIALQVGQSTESVTVTAESSLLQTESSQLVHNVTLSQLDNLPLLTVGATNDGLRDYFAASRLLPGIQYSDSGASSAVVTAVVNGTPSNTLQTRLDGATMNPTSLRLLGATMETQPSTDSIQEVAILTSNFAPEFGTAGGAVVNMVTKSGTNSLHGTGYDYLVNEALNAAQPYTGIKNKLRQNDYGFTVGGPVWIPKLYNGKNKTFFFFSFEQFRQKLINDTLPDTVPIAAYRGGDFSSLITTENRLVTTASGPYTDPLGRTIPSGTIFDPTDSTTINGVVVRNPFPGNRIPVSRFDPVAAKILALIPQPLGPSAGAAGANYLAPFDESRVSSIPSIKVDQSVGDKLHMAFYFQRTNTSTPRTATAADDLPNNITGSAISANAARTGRVNLDYTATPRLLLHSTLGWNDSDFILQSQNFPFDAQSALGIPGQTAARTFPIINTNGLSALSIANTQPTNLAEGGLSTIGGSFDQHFFERRPAFNISATYVRGAHTFKLGGEIRQQKYPNYNWSGSAGNYQFGGSTALAPSNYTTQPSLAGTTISSGFAGFGLASFLLGGVSGATINAPIAAMTENYESALFLQDSWKVTRKLTVDYGLRWDYGTYQHEQFGRYASFSSTVANPSAGGHLGGQIFEATCNCNFAHNYPYAIGPRLGAAYQVNSKTVVNGGFGIVYGANTAQTGSTTNVASASTPGFGQIVGQLQNGIPSNVSIQWPTFSAGAGQAPGAVVAPPTLLDPNAGRPMRLLQWNFTVQREITPNMIVKAAYVGNRGVWEEAGTSLAPQNAVSQATLQSLGFTDLTSRAQSDLLTLPIASLSAAQKTQLAAQGVNLQPYPGFPTSQNVLQAIKPYPQYTGLLASAGAPLGKNWYDALQTTFTKRFSHGLVANANYTWSKTLALTTTQDPFNRNLGKNLSTYDLPHQFRLTAQYEVPLFHSKLPVLENKVVAYALSGWSTGWSLSYQSAPLVGLPTSSGSVPISNFLGYGPGPAQLIPGANPWSVDWTDLSGKHHTDPLNINCHCFDPTRTQVLNPASWTNVPNGQFAANESSIRSFRGIRIPVENANFGRDFRIKERYSLNIRVEFTNIFNRLQLPTAAGAAGGINLGNFTSAPTKFTSGANTGAYSGGFGTIVSPLTGSVVGQRAGTLVARFTF